MYLDFFGFSAAPFELTPDPRFLYLPPGHQEALSTLQYGVLSGKGLTVLTGEAGMGKTTLLRTALQQLHGVAMRVITISNPALTRPEFIEIIARSLQTPEPIGATKPAVLAALEKALVHDDQNGTKAVLIADEAHAMPDDLLEEIRLLGNFETETRKLLSIILVGQPELAERLNQSSLRQLKQRVALRSALSPFSASETSAYVDTRVRVVGRTAADVFSAEALDRVHAVSGGIPRVINVVCDNALLSAFAADRRVVDARAIDDVAKDLDLLAEVEEGPHTDHTSGAERAQSHASASSGAHSVSTAHPQGRPGVSPQPVETKPDPHMVLAAASHHDAGKVAPAASSPQVHRRQPDVPSRPKAPAPAGAAADRESGLFTIYTKRKGFFSRVFS